MSWSPDAWYAELAGFLNASQQSVEQWIWGGLVLSFLFASVHLVTMLVTRWGDHHASTKALLFSVLIHLSSGAGVFVLAPAAVRQQVQEDLEPMQMQQIEIAGVRDTPEQTPGNTPIWETIPLSKADQISRMQREILEPEPPQTPERKTESESPLLTEISPPDRTLPRELDQPELALNSTQQILNDNAEIAEMADATLPQLESPAMTESQSRKIQRSQLPRSLADAETIERPESGGVDQISPVITDMIRRRAPDIQRGPTPELLDSPVKGDIITKRVAPQQATDDDLLTGQKSPNGDAASKMELSENRTITRSMRSNSSAVDGPQPNRTTSPEKGSLVDPTQLALTTSLPEIEDLPELGLPSANFDTIRRGESVQIPATYRLRDLQRRKQIARQYGGTDASEEAVERSLAWLAARQEPAGFWDGSKYGAGTIEIDDQGINRRNAGIEADTGLTGLTILAFLGAGYTQQEGKYAETVSKAIDWLISQQREDGYLGAEATRYAGMYCHGMAAYALAEAYGMRSEQILDDELARAVKKAVQFTVAMQNKGDGGWRYMADWSGDMSMFGWHMMALKSAEIAGISPPQESKTLMVKFLVDRSLGENKGLAAYHPEYNPEVTAPMTAEALFCKQMLGIPRGNPASREAAQYLLQPENLPKQSQPNLYYWYYGTLAMYQYGGDEWNQWNGLLRELLVESQVKQGRLSGSWNPEGPWGGYGGRIYSTALATLSLEVYYRFLPLYRINE